MKPSIIFAIFTAIILGSFSTFALADKTEDFIKAVKREKLNEVKTQDLAMGFYNANKETLSVSEVVALAKLINSYEGNELLKQHVNYKKNLTSAELRQIAQNIDTSFANGYTERYYELAIRKRFLKETNEPQMASFIREMQYIAKDDSNTKLRAELINAFYTKYAEYFRGKPAELIKLASDLPGYEKNELLAKYIKQNASVLTPAQIENISSSFDRSMANERSDKTYSIAIRKKFIDNTKAVSNIDSFISALKVIKESKIKESLISDFYDRYKTKINMAGLFKMADLITGYEKNQLINKFAAYNAEILTLNELDAIAKKYQRDTINDSKSEVRALKLARQFAVAPDALNKCIANLKKCAD